MATHGIYQLYSNDQDKIYTESKYLSRRLRLIRNKRYNDPSIPNSEATPFLKDIEKTHILFPIAHFKPFAAIGHEYNCNRSNHTNVRLGELVQFSIPSFGDFFADMVFHCVIKAPKVTYTPSDATEIAPSVRWADYPGERLMKRTRFIINYKPLDEYTSDEIVMHRQFRVPDHKLTGWKRIVGQQIPATGYIKNTNQNIPGYQIYMNYCDGLQTPKDASIWNSLPDKKRDLEVFVPLLFWCNTDICLAAPSVCLPFGQRFIEIELEQQDKLFNWQRRGNNIPDISIGNAIILKAELYINNLFVDPEIHEVLIKRIGFTLIRVHRKQTNIITKMQDTITLDSIKWNVENMYVGLRPSININGGEINPITNKPEPSSDLWNWHLFSEVNCNTKEIYGFTKKTNLICHECKPTFKTITITMYGIRMTTILSPQFYNSYIPYTYGDYNINTPKDPGLLMITFCLYPGTYQPSGSINASKIPDFNITFTTISPFDNINTGELIVCATSINALLLSDGKCVLKFQ